MTSRSSGGRPSGLKRSFNSNGLQPSRNGLQPNSDGLQPNSDGLHDLKDGEHLKFDGLRMKYDGILVGTVKQQKFVNSDEEASSHSLFDWPGPHQTLGCAQ